MKHVLTQRLVKNCSIEFHEQFGYRYNGTDRWTWSSCKAFFLTLLRTPKMDAACSSVMSDSHVWKVYDYRYSDNFDCTNCACKPCENMHFVFEG
jgi:hypothetical protein